ncbi:MAG: signal peptidase I [Schleiferiaceae bacterium]|nr:signal peptidase I [Schleiferiaceae bacterium]
MLDLLAYYLIINFWSSILTWKFFKSAGRSNWEAWLPVYRTVVLLKIVDRPKWWAILCYIPVVDNIMSIIISYEILHIFGFRDNKYIFLTVPTCGAYMGYLSYTSELTLQPRDNRVIRQKIPSVINHIFFALVAAGAVRMTTFEAYNIPTGSMEKSLMIGDYLFVSKLHYGLRIPNTPISIPLMHNLIPYTSIPSYLDWVNFSYLRLPAFVSVEKGDAVVFNVPVDPGRPVDKKDNYVKRCVATPGDTISIVDRQVMINSSFQEFPERANPQWSYYVRTKGKGFNPRQLKRDFDINYLDNRIVSNQNLSDVIQITNSEYMITISTDALPRFEAQNNIDTVICMNTPGDNLFDEKTPEAIKWYNENYIKPMLTYPNPDGHSDTIVFKWSRDNYGPFWIPASGQVVELNYQNVLKYGRAINVYEGHDLEFKNDQYYLDGVPTTSYTFSLDYYWMMGDNRHNSWDSRYWGMVPEDHILGKPVFIFMSKDGFVKGFLSSIRSERLFTVIHGKGEPTSYLYPFLFFVAVYLGWEKFRKRKKANN